MPPKRTKSGSGRDAKENGSKNSASAVTHTTPSAPNTDAPAPTPSKVWKHDDYADDIRRRLKKANEEVQIIARLMKHYVASEQATALLVQHLCSCKGTTQELEKEFAKFNNLQKSLGEEQPDESTDGNDGTEDPFLVQQQLQEKAALAKEFYLLMTEVAEYSEKVNARVKQGTKKRQGNEKGGQTKTAHSRSALVVGLADDEEQHDLLGNVLDGLESSEEEGESVLQKGPGKNSGNRRGEDQSKRPLAGSKEEKVDKGSPDFPPLTGESNGSKIAPPLVLDSLKDGTASNSTPGRASFGIATGDDDLDLDDPDAAREIQKDLQLFDDNKLLDAELQFTRDVLVDRQSRFVRIERDVIDVHDMFSDISKLVHAQEEMMDDIENNISTTRSAVQESHDELELANKYMKDKRQRMCCYLFMLACLAIIFVWFLVSLFPSGSGGGGSGGGDHSSTASAPFVPLSKHT